jgi:hypothetical protein
MSLGVQLSDEEAIMFVRNDQQRLSTTKCKVGSPWYIWASPDSRLEGFQIKKHCSKHSCSKTWKINSFSSNFLAGKYVEQFRADEGMSLKNFSRVVQKQWNMEPNRSKLWRARRLALQKKNMEMKLLSTCNCGTMLMR